MFPQGPYKLQSKTSNSNEHKKSQAGDFPRRDAESLKNRDVGRQRVSTVIIGFEIALRSDVALTNTVLWAAAIS